jgi:hypothetical protein
MGDGLNENVKLEPRQYICLPDASSAIKVTLESSVVTLVWFSIQIDQGWEYGSVSTTAEILIQNVTIHIVLVGKLDFGIGCISASLSPSVKEYSDAISQAIASELRNINIPFHSKNFRKHKRDSYKSDLLVGDSINAIQMIMTNTRFELAEQKEIRKKKWSQFKTDVLKNNSSLDGYLFRGVSNSSYTLISSFHRTGRNSLHRYRYVDMPIFEKNISRYIRHKFDLESSEDFGELMFLGQHYGFPSPLLDWSRSPFVAAYFAFSEIDPVKNQKKSKDIKSVAIVEYARIYFLNEAILRKVSGDKPSLFSFFSPTIMLNEFRSTFNDRSGPQQGVSTFTSEANFYFWLSNMLGMKFKDEYSITDLIDWVDIPYSERDKVLHDLYKMGISSESLFPGIDGASEALKYKLFLSK